jgi:GT2 family glycosyltransferase
VKEMADLPLVAVIVVNWNGLADTESCLRSVLASDYPRLHVLVVDNGSEGDDVAALRRRFGDRVEVVEAGRNLGYAGACNLGMTLALARGAEAVLLLNNDATVAPECIMELVKAASSLPDAAALCPKIYFSERPNIIQSTGGKVNMWLGRSRQVGRGEVDRGQWDRLQERDYADGACMLITKRALTAVGPLDEEYFAYWEETDWCFRARELGFRCYYVPTARAWHRGSSSFSRSRYWFYYRRGAIMFLRKRARPVQLVTALLYHVLVLAPFYVLRRPWGLGRLLVEGRAILWHLGRRVAKRPFHSTLPR